MHSCFGDSDRKTFGNSQKNTKKVKKVEKTRKKGVPKKGSNLGYFVPGAIFGKKCEKWPPNSPPSGTFLFFLTLPRSCFYTVAVLVVGGVQSGGKFFCSFLITFFGVWEFVLSILGVDIIQKGGGGGGGGVERVWVVWGCTKNINTKISGY